MNGQKMKHPVRAGASAYKIYAPGLRESEKRILNNEFYYKNDIAYLEQVLKNHNDLLLWEPIEKIHGNSGKFFISFAPKQEEKKTYVAAASIYREYIPNVYSARAIANNVASGIKAIEGTPYYVVVSITKERVDKPEYVEVNKKLLQKFPQDVKNALLRYGINAQVVGQLVPMTFSRLGEIVGNDKWLEKNWRKVRLQIFRDATDANNNRLFKEFGDANPNAIIPSSKLYKIIHSKFFWEFKNALLEAGGGEIYFPNHLNSEAIGKCYSKMREACISYRYELHVDKKTGKVRMDVEGAENLDAAFLRRVYLQLDGTKVRANGEEEYIFRYDKKKNDMRLVGQEKKEINVFKDLGEGESFTFETQNMAGGWEARLKVVRAYDQKNAEKTSGEKEKLMKAIAQSGKQLQVVVATDESRSLKNWAKDVDDAAEYIDEQIKGAKKSGFSVKIIEIEGEEGKKDWELYFETLEHQLEKWEKEERGENTRRKKAGLGPRNREDMPVRHFIYNGDGFFDYNYTLLSEIVGMKQKAGELTEKAKNLNARVDFIEIGGSVEDENEVDKKCFEVGLGKIKSFLRSLTPYAQLAEDARWNADILRQKIETGKPMLEERDRSESQKQIIRSDIRQAEWELKKFEQQAAQHDMDHEKELWAKISGKMEILELYTKKGIWGFPVYLLREIVRETGGKCGDFRARPSNFFAESENKEGLIIDILKMLKGEQAPSSSRVGL
ncbi:MAG: hypothetical protein ABIH83_03990 [Candidatus Micrarchaeota archaeon]